MPGFDTTVLAGILAGGIYRRRPWQDAFWAFLFQECSEGLRMNVKTRRTMIEAQAFTHPSRCQSPADAPAFLKDRHLITQITEQHSAGDAGHPGTNNCNANGLDPISHELQPFPVAPFENVVSCFRL
jgi:hypothetical protein